MCAGVIVIVSPQIHLAKIDAIIRVGVSDICFHGSGPRFAHWNDTAHVWGHRRRIVASAHVIGHGGDRLSGPGTVFRVDLISARPGCHQVDVDSGIAVNEDVGHLFHRFHQLARISGLVEVKRALAMHNHGVPGTSGDQTQSILKVKIQTTAGFCFKRDLVVEPRLLRKGLKQGRHAANTQVIEVCHGIGSIKTHRRPKTKSKTVADKQHALAGLCERLAGKQHQSQGGQFKSSHGVFSF